MHRERRAICGICAAGCWVVVEYDEQGRMVSVRADEESPLGAICPAGERSPQVVYSEQRLRRPLRRTGPKGTYEFEPISWDDAYDLMVSELQRVKAESGPEATAVYTGSGSFELAFCDRFQPAGVEVSSAASVLFPFGSPNTLGVGALCYVAFAMIAPHTTMGSMHIHMFPDLENAELIVVWGKNPAAHCPPHDFLRIQRAHQRGARIVVIDPRRTGVAKLPGARWIPIRPGTDGALALSLCQALLEEELHDEAFAEEWTRGFPDFRRYVQHFRPEAAERICGVPRDTIRELAREIGGADGAAPVMYSGLEYSDSGVQAIRAAMTLWALAGQLDRPGGSCFKMRGNRFPVSREGLVANPDVRKAAGHNRFPVYTRYRGEFHAGILPQAVLKGDPYPIRLMISLGANLIASWPRSQVWRETLGALDFLVCIDRQLTEDAAYADLVLPAATYYEIESYMVYDSVFRLRERVIPPVGEARSDFFILAELARRLGYGHLYPQSEQELLVRTLAGSGFTPEDVREAGGTVRVTAAMMEYRKWEKGLLRPDGQPGFDTPSGKFEIASTILEEHGYDPLPVYVEPGEGPLARPDLARRFPLVFNSGARSKTDLHALHLSVPELSRDKPVPTVALHSDDAAARGVRTGDLVELRTLRGRVEMYAVVTDDIVAGAVEASAMGGGPLGDEAWQKACVNDLTDLDRCDPISGFPVYKALLCEVAKTGSGSARATGTSEYGAARVVVEEESQPIYLDHNATTPLDPAVREAMVSALDRYGNPSSLYADGREARKSLEAARRRVALLLNTTARRIVFTGGGSEANNLALKGIALAAGNGGHGEVITSRVEHPSVLNACRWLERRGVRVTYLEVDGSGRVRPADLRAALSDDTVLVSVMAAHNETGTLQPVAELAEEARRRGVLFHTDAVQAAGKVPLDVEDLGVDLLTLSGHKFHGPKGVGALYVRKGVPLEALISGGHQEGGLRAGTENVPGIVGLGRAADLALDRLPRMQSVSRLRDRLEAGISDLLAGCRRNGPAAGRLPHTTSLLLPGYRGESVVIALDQRGVCASPGSACRAGDPEPSHALLAMGLTEEEAHCSLRFSLGLGTTEEEIDRVLRLMREILHGEQEAIRFVSCR